MSVCSDVAHAVGNSSNLRVGAPVVDFALSIAFDIADGEAILTEYSHKYTLDGFAAMAEAAGFRVQKVWTDPDELFSVQFLTRQ